MLNYLVKSEARRLILAVLFGESAKGTITDLASRAHVGFATAHREIRELRRFGLVTDDPIVRVNDEHPDVPLLRQLVSRGTQPDTARSNDAAAIRGRLRRIGAPLLGGDEDAPDGELHETIVEGVRLSRRDPTVARVMPFVLWRHREK